MCKITGIIYKCTNIINNKVYIGQTVQKVEARFRNHVYQANRPGSRAYNTYFSHAIRKYGKYNFKHEVVFETKSNSKENIGIILDVVEKLLIKKFNSQNPNIGYNTTEGGKRTKMSEIVCLKMSQERCGSGNNFYGKHHTEETKLKISKANSGRKRTGRISGWKWTDEQKLNLSKALKNIPKRPYKKAPLSQEHKENIRKSHIGVKFSEERKLNISKATSKYVYTIYDKNGNVLYEDLTLKQASDITGMCPSGVKYRSQHPVKILRKYNITRKEVCLEYH